MRRTRPLPRPRRLEHLARGLLAHPERREEPIRERLGLMDLGCRNGRLRAP
jgi:hypothetical protein